MKTNNHRIISVFLCFAMLISVFGISDFKTTTYAIESTIEESQASSLFTEGDFTFREIDENSVELWRYEGHEKDIIIPARTLDGRLVVSIGSYENTYIRGVEEANQYAFEYCTFIDSITLPDTISVISNRAFLFCSLKRVQIPDSVTEIDNMAFYGTSLKKVIIPDSVSKIEDEAFCSCESLVNVTMSNSLNSVPYKCFSGCKSLTSIVLPDTCRVINSSAFENCSSLSSVNIPDNCFVNSWAFRGCSSLEEVSIPGIDDESKTDIRDGAFEKCTSLKRVNFGRNVNIFWSDVFSGCIALEQINVDPQSEYFTSIDGVLYTKDKKVLRKVPAHKDFSSDFEILEGVETISNNCFEDCSSLSNVIIPNTVTTIGSFAFNNCTSLKSINIPASVNKIIHSYVDGCTFDGCISLESINVSSNNESYSSLNGILCNKNKSTIICVPQNYQFESTYTIPDSITTISDYAFFNCSNLKQLYLSETIKHIGYYSFYCCKSLSNINLPNSIEYIGSGAFSYCNLLPSITIPNAVTEIGVSTFSGCSSLNDIIIPESVTSIHRSAFRDCVSLKNVSIGTSVTLIGDGAFEGCSSLKGMSISKSVTRIGESAFSGCSSLPILTVPDNITSIESKAFENCDLLTIRCHKDSYAEKYAIENNIPYDSISNEILLQYDVTNATIQISPESFTFDDTEKQPSVTLKYGNNALTQNKDYFVSYYNNVNVGTATVTVAGIGDYYGTKTATFTINPKPKTDISNCTLTLSQTEYTYDGTEKQPSVIVKDGSTTLAKDNDYTVEYSNNVNLGTGKVIINGNGDYVGSTSVEFSIIARSIENALVTLDQDSFTYDGYEKRPTVTVKLDARTLTNDVDYYVLYTNNVNAGTATVTVAGKGNYSGSKSVNFTINSPSYEKKAFVWGQDNWNFINSDLTGHFSSGTYRSQINQTYLNHLRDVLSPTDYQIVFQGDKDNLAWLDENFRGSCYGMSSTVFLAKQGLLPFGEYQRGASTLYELDYPMKNPLDFPANNANVSSLITYYQMLQVTDPVYLRKLEVGNRSKEENIKDIIALLDKSDTVLIGFRKDEWGGHAILAYDYEYGSYTKNGITYQGRIRICDPNSSNTDNDSFYLYFNTRSYNWAIPAYSRVGISSTSGARITNVCADVDVINYGGYLSSNSNDFVSDKFVARIDAYAISDNRSVSKVKKASKQDGDYSMMDNGNDDIEEEYSYIDANESKGVIGYNLYDANSAYKVVQEDSVNMQLSMHYENCYLTGGSKAGESIIFDKNGYIEVNGESAEYHMSMTVNDNYPTDWFTVSVIGESANQAALSLKDNGWVISADDLTNVRVDVNNKFDAAYTTFTTEYPSALIYEIDKDTIGIAVDTDNNGTYETTLDTVTQKADVDITNSDTDLTTDTTSDVDDSSDINSDKSSDTDTDTHTDSDTDTSKDVDTESDSDNKTDEQTDTDKPDIPDDKPNGTYGDLDGDGDITANDALMILRASVGMETLTSEQITLADVDGDGDITANDALAVLRYSVGMGDGGSVGKPTAA